MGGTRSSAGDWASYTSTTRDAFASGAATFKGTFTTTHGVKEAYDPSKIVVRESRASEANPHPTPVIVALDCTGSMQDLAVSAITNIGTLMAETYDKLPITDPHIMAMFFDDVITAPNEALQATQFEADKVIIDQLKDLWFVGRGGGNSSESSTLPWHFALHKCECDAFSEGRKGFLFTIGDDGVPPELTPAQLKAIYGDDFEVSESVSAQTLLEQLEENWHVFNIIPTRGDEARYRSSHIGQTWDKLLNERNLYLSDISKLAEVLVATMQVIAGADAAAVVDSFVDPGTALVVKKAIEGLVPATTGGVVRL